MLFITIYFFLTRLILLLKLSYIIKKGKLTTFFEAKGFKELKVSKSVVYFFAYFYALFPEIIMLVSMLSKQAGLILTVKFEREKEPVEQ